MFHFVASTVFCTIATPKERLWGWNLKVCCVHDSKHQSGLGFGGRGMDNGCDCKLPFSANISALLLWNLLVQGDFWMRKLLWYRHRPIMVQELVHVVAVVKLLLHAYVHTYVHSFISSFTHSHSSCTKSKSWHTPVQSLRKAFGTRLWKVYYMAIRYLKNVN